MKVLCPICKATAQEYKESPFRTGRRNPSTGKEIIIAEAYSYSCTKCQFEWITKAQEEKIERDIFKEVYIPIAPNNITKLRNALPIKTKKGLANFLCLNEKAFVHWENGNGKPNPAYDLLLRLIARSEDNFKFVKELHEKGFKFDPKDYYYLDTKNNLKCN